jgi:hypothetical protein
MLVFENRRRDTPRRWFNLDLIWEAPGGDWCDDAFDLISAFSAISEMPRHSGCGKRPGIEPTPATTMYSPGLDGQRAGTLDAVGQVRSVCPHGRTEFIPGN